MEFSDYINFMESERKRQHMTREQLEEKSGVSASTFLKWVRGVNKAQLEPFVLVMRALGYDVVLRRKK